ncbi:alpha-L-glutamate ligase-like protein [Hyphococcus luteus]|uniref:Alpha-L-glutamate ligase-like protein n=1 Tax=Hyphococcus luteus TaxID=2058213 RepID=A0A2S7K244_9PROT|nr:alpha-L-glutamate ligase-like protein [Marinicaulis flavus]PQA86531.1 alpha-L-glutamate ligase-like protein [Marinicaulis flavus]
MLKTFKALRANGVIGINERNVAYVSALNPRKFLNRVDDKLLTKQLVEPAGIPAPALYGVIENARDMKRLEEFIGHPDGFVIKPAQGSQGKGIVVVEGPLKGGWRLSSGKRIDLDAMKFQINNMISGMYSLGGQPDRALIEYRVKFDDVFGKVSFRGVPDIRLIVLKGIPVFAMLRLPTAESDGKANLHKGGVGAGIDLATGRTMQAMQHDKFVEIHPDTAHPLEDIQTPYWDEILLMAAKSYEVTELGYIGVDVVLDREKGPLLLELNARPGISIQIANRKGMRFVLEKAMALGDEARTPEERVAIAKTLSDAAPVKPGKLEPAVS